MGDDCTQIASSIAVHHDDREGHSKTAAPSLLHIQKVVCEAESLNSEEEIVTESVTTTNHVLENSTPLSTNNNDNIISNSSTNTTTTTTTTNTDDHISSPAAKRKKTYGRRSERALRDIRELGQVDAEKKNITCNYCQCSQYLNVTKFKHHIVECASCPFEVKEKYVHVRDLFNLDNHGIALSLGTKGFLANCQKRFCEAVVESNFSVSDFHTEKWISFFQMISPSFKVPNAREITADSPDESNLEIHDYFTSALDSSINSFTIFLDGWCSGVNEKELCLVFCRPEPFLAKCVSIDHQMRRDAKFLKRLLNPTLHSIGMNRCCGILIENGAHKVQIEESLRATYKHFHFLGCFSTQLHLLSLDLKNKTHLFRNTLNCFNSIISTFANSRPLDVAFANYCRSKSIRTFYLKRWQSDRFFGLENTFHSFIVTEPHLKQFVLEWADDGSAEILSEINEIKRLINNNNQLWPQVKFAYQLLKAIRKTIDSIESADNSLGDVVFHFKCLQKAVIKLVNDQNTDRCSADQILDVLNQHQQVFESKLTLMANLLDPKHRGSDLTPSKTAAAIAAFQEYVDEHVSDGESKRNVLQAFSQYLSQSGHFNKLVFWNNRVPIDNSARRWWKQFGDFQMTKRLSDLCVDLFSIPISSAILWNQFDADSFFNTDLGKRLKWERFRPLLSVYLYLKAFNGKSVRYREYRTVMEQLKTTHPNPELRPHIEILNESDFELLENHFSEIDLQNYVQMNLLRRVSIFD